MRTVVGKATGVGDANSFGFANVKIETIEGTTEWAASRIAGLIGEARRVKDAGEVRAWDLIDKTNPEKINPQTGQPYVNTYIEAIRFPAQYEVNGGAVLPGVNAQTVPQAPSTGQPAFATSGGSGYTVTPAPFSSSTQDEFRRSKEEMRWTEALNIAATLAPTVGANTYENFKTLAWNIEALIQEKA